MSELPDKKHRQLPTWAADERFASYSPEVLAIWDEAIERRRAERGPMPREVALRLQSDSRRRRLKRETAARALAEEAEAEARSQRRQSRRQTGNASASGTGP